MTRRELTEMSVKELKSVAKSVGIKGYSSMNKADLIEAIEQFTRTVSVLSSEEESVMLENDSKVSIVAEDNESKRKYMEYLTYRDELRPVVTKEVNWKGKMRPRYECPLCSVKIGNPEDHFCYNCGARLRADDAYEKYVENK